MSDTHESPPSDARSGNPALRLLKMLGLVVVGLCGLALIAALAFVYTGSSARWITNSFASDYDERVPGSVELSDVQGNLAQGVELRELKLHDRDGRPLFTLDRLRLEAGLIGFFQGRLRVEDFTVEGATIVMPAEGEPGFADLRPERKDSDKDRQDRGPGEGSVYASVALKNVRVLQRETPEQPLEEARLLGHLDHADLTLTSEGGQGELSIDLALDAPALEDLKIESATVAATWSEGVISVGASKVDSNWGRVEVDGLKLDPKGSVDIDGARIDAEPAFFAARTGVTPTGQPHIEAKGRLGLDGSDFELVADLHGAGKGKARVWQEDSSTMLLRYELDADLPVARWQETAALEALSFSAAGKVESVALGAWGVTGKVECQGCESGDPSGPVDATLELDGRVSAMKGSGKATLKAAVAGSELDVKLESGKEAPTRVDGSLSASEMGRFVLWLSKLGVEQPAFEALEMSFSCEGEKLSALPCVLTGMTSQRAEMPIQELPAGMMRALGFG